MKHLAAASCDVMRDVTEVPEWVHLLPAGEISARDGRRFRLDNPDAVIAAFEAGGIDIPIDYNHAADRKDVTQSGPVPAAGWIKALANRGGEIWGRVEWTARARDLIGNREYRFLSPAILYDPKTFEIGRIKGAGLVHAPALNLVALASQEDSMPPENTLLARLAAMLDMPPESAEVDVLDALAARLAAPGSEGVQSPDPRKFVPVETLQELLRERSQSVATLSEERAAAKVKSAFDKGYITPAMRNWALDLCRADEAAFDEFMRTAVPAFASLSQEIIAGRAPGAGSPGIHDPETLAVCAQLGLTPDKLV